MAGIRGLEVTELSNDRRLMDPRRPNWTPGQPPAPPGPANAVATRPYTPNWTIPESTGARQPFDVEMKKPMGRIIGKAAGQGMRALGKLAPVAAGVDVVSRLGDYRIDDPEVDSSVAGTLRAVKAGDFGGAGRSLSKGALEAGMDVGSFAANTADLFVPGDAPVSRAYDRMLRGAFGDQLISNSGNTPDAGAGRGFVNPPAVSAFSKS